MRIRVARSDDLAALQRIERAAGEAFRDVGMDDIAEHEPPSTDTLREYHKAGRAWVAVDDGDRPVAYVLVDVVDGCAHIEQVSVHPDHARQRIGRTLLDHVETWAADHRIDALTLTTFRAVPWNGPYYERLGFHELTGKEITPGLAALVADEAEYGLDPAERVCMRREVRPRTAPKVTAAGG